MFPGLRRKRSSIFFKILLVHLCVVLLLYFMSLVIYSWGLRSLEAASLHALTSRCRYELRSLETEVQHILNVQRDYALDYDLQTLSVGPGSLAPFDRRKAILDIQDKLRAIVELSTLVENAVAHVSSVNKSIPADGSIDDLNNSEYTGVLDAAAASRGKAVVVWSGRLFLHLAYPPALGARTVIPFFAIDVEISEDALHDRLASFVPTSPDSRGGAFLVGYDGSWTVGNAEYSRFKDDVMARLAEGKISDRGSSVRISGDPYFFAEAASPLLDANLFLYLPRRDVLGSLVEFRLLLSIISISAIILSALFSFWIYQAIEKPLNKLRAGFAAVERGDLSSTVLHPVADELGYACEHFNKMACRLRLSVNQMVEEQSRARYAEMKQLQYQINPHFLHNSIFSIYRMARKHRDEQLSTFIRRLSEFYGYITRGDIDVVTLKEEMDHVRSYVDIQLLRFSNRIRAYCSDVPSWLGSIMVPKLCLQPIVENALEHGLRNKVSGGILRVDIREVNQFLELQIEDNGTELSSETLRAMREALCNGDSDAFSTGLVNVHRRVQLRHGRESGIALERSNLGGLKVILTIHIEEVIGSVSPVGC